MKKDVAKYNDYILYGQSRSIAMIALSKLFRLNAFSKYNDVSDSIAYRKMIEIFCKDLGIQKSSTGEQYCHDCRYVAAIVLSCRWLFDTFNEYNVKLINALFPHIQSILTSDGIGDSKHVVNAATTPMFEDPNCRRLLKFSMNVNVRQSYFPANGGKSYIHIFTDRDSDSKFDTSPYNDFGNRHFFHEFPPV